MPRKPSTKKTKVDTPKGLTVKVKTKKSNEFGKDKIRITVTLLQDGKEIASDSDFVTL